MPHVLATPLRSDAVLVVSSNQETLDGLTDYLRRAGIACEGRRKVNPLAELPRLGVLILFPDDFLAHEVVSYLSLIGARYRELAIVLVTRDAPAYAELTSTDGHPLRPVLLARPAFGWTILDAVRAAREGAAP